jgi:hypothetical protein
MRGGWWVEASGIGCLDCGRCKEYTLNRTRCVYWNHCSTNALLRGTTHAAQSIRYPTRNIRDGSHSMLYCRSTTGYAGCLLAQTVADLRLMKQACCRFRRRIPVSYELT